MTEPLTDQQLAEIEAALRSFIPGIKDDSTVTVTITEQEANGLRNSWSGPASSVLQQIEDQMLRASATPSPEQPVAATEAGRAALRAKFSGGAFPAALGQAIADELADAAMAPLLAEVHRLRAELEQARADVARIQRWAAETVHGSAAAEVLLLIRNLVEPPAPARA